MTTMTDKVYALMVDVRVCTRNWHTRLELLTCGSVSSHSSSVCFDRIVGYGDFSSIAICCFYRTK